MVTELINECMDYGIVTQLQQHIVLERLHSRYLPPKQPMFDLGRPGSQRASHFRCVRDLAGIQQRTTLQLLRPCASPHITATS